MAIVDQQYHGDMTIHPKMQPKGYLTLLGKPSLQEYRDYFLSGERDLAKIAMIRARPSLDRRWKTASCA